jgi:tyrosine-protein phosphatase SIW14
MVRWQVGVFGPLAVLACVAAPVTLAVMEQRQIKNFHVVRPGVLYRSAQLTPTGLRRVVHDQRIRTVVNLREGTARFDLAEEEFCRREEIRFIRLPPKGWDDSFGPAGVDDNVRVFLDVMRDPANYPVLVHCFAGIHRTGAYCAVYRMEFEGWDNASAIAEVKAMGYDNFDNELDIKGWLEGYKVGRFRAKARGQELAEKIRPGMSGEEVRRLVGPCPADQSKTGECLVVGYRSYGLTVMYVDGKVCDVTYRPDRVQD